MKFLRSIPLLLVGALGVLVAFGSNRSPVLAERDHQHDLELVQQAQQGKFDPLPAIALSPAIPEKGYRLEKLGDGLYMVTEGTYQMMFLTTSKGVIAVDAPPTIGGNILKAIREVTEEPITHVIYTHAHADHIGGASLYPKTAIIIGQESTARQLKVARDPNRPVPSITFKNKYALTIGNQTLQLEYKGPNHSDDNIFIYAPKQKVLMVIDVIYPGWVPFKELAVSEDIPGWIKAHDQILEYPFEQLVTGHLGRVGTRQDVLTQREYVHDLEVAGRNAITSLKFEDVLKRVGADANNSWALFQAYLDMASEMTTKEMLAKWRDKLGAADVFTFDHAQTIVESLRIDYGVLGPFGIRP